VEGAEDVNVAICLPVGGALLDVVDHVDGHHVARLQVPVLDLLRVELLSGEVGRRREQAVAQMGVV
jgi:hypothetical protein